MLLSKHVFKILPRSEFKEHNRAVTAGDNYPLPVGVIFQKHVLFAVVILWRAVCFKII